MTGAHIGRLGVGRTMDESYFFDDVVRAHTGAGFVSRDWLYDEVETALDRPDCRYVLLTAEPIRPQWTHPGR